MQKSWEETSWKYSQNSHQKKNDRLLLFYAILWVGNIFLKTNTILKKSSGNTCFAKKYFGVGGVFLRELSPTPLNALCKAKKEIKLQHILHLRWPPSSSCRTYVTTLPGINVSAWCCTHLDFCCWRDDTSRESPTTRCECPAQVLVMLSHSSSHPCPPTSPWASGTVFCFILHSLPKDSLVTNDRITNTARQSRDVGCICHFYVWPKLPLDFGPLELWKYAIK